MTCVTRNVTNADTVMPRPSPNFDFETEAVSRGFSAVCGVDEVGRGPLAGPVTARREVLAEQIHAKARVSIAHCSVKEIDRLNILGASLLAMERAVQGLDGADFALIDGNKTPKGLSISAMTVVKGDARVLSIAAASIVAKISRDEIMVGLAQQFPGYGWERNAGYPTAEHRAALLKNGVTPHHRVSFKPVHNMLYQEKL